LLGDENASLLRKVNVTIQCLYELKELPNGEEDSLTMNQFENNFTEYFTYSICSINIDSKLKWPMLDGIVSYVFKRYLNKIDPNKSLGLDKHSIEQYTIGEVTRKINDLKCPDLLPFGYLIGDSCSIRIVLKGKFTISIFNSSTKIRINLDFDFKDNLQSLDALSFETLTPKYLLEDYVSVLAQHQFIAINSLYKFGKTFLIRKLAQFTMKK
jgi:hypothetical protein